MSTRIEEEKNKYNKVYTDLVFASDDLKQMLDEDELNKRIFKFPTSQIKLNGRKSSYFEIISSLRYKEYNEALTRIFPRINMNDIFNLIDNI